MLKLNLSLKVKKNWYLKFKFVLINWFYLISAEIASSTTNISKKPPDVLLGYLQHFQPKRTIPTLWYLGLLYNEFGEEAVRRSFTSDKLSFNSLIAAVIQIILKSNKSIQVGTFALAFLGSYAKQSKHNAMFLCNSSLMYHLISCFEMIPSSIDVLSKQKTTKLVDPFLLELNTTFQYLCINSKFHQNFFCFSLITNVNNYSKIW